MPKSFLTHWRGLLCAAICVIATLWLAASGRLDWYIHPKYLPFTVTMSAIGALATLGSCWVLLSERRAARARSAADALAADALAVGADGRAVRRGLGYLRGLGSLILVGALAGAMLLLPPKTLTAATAAQRSVNASLQGSAASGQGTAQPLGDGAALGVREWSQLLFTDGGSQLIGREATLEGFISPDPDPTRNDVFYVTRFVVTHCVIDAQPVGVPVLLPDWRAELSPDDWVTVRGAFADDPQPNASHPVVLLPTQTELTPAPENPYVF